MDFAFAIRNRLPMARLRKRKPLYLANGELSTWIEFDTMLQLWVGDHRETISLFVTTLA